MNEEEQSPGSDADRAIEHGETYEHAEHGTVKITGIYQRTRRLDTTAAADERPLVVIRYVPEGGGWIDELAAKRDEFCAAVDVPAATGSNGPNEESRS